MFYIGNGKGELPQILNWLFPYIALLILLSIFSKYKIVGIISSILWIPGLLLVATGPLIQTIGSIIFAYIIILGGTTCLVLIVAKEIIHYPLEFSAGIYLVLTISSIIATTCSEKLIKSWHDAQNRDYKEFSENLSLQLFGHNKIRFLIFIIYFILLIIFTFTTLNKIPILKQDNVDTAILQSFATYVAFDRIVSNRTTLKKKQNK